MIIQSWKIKLILPIIYFVATITVFYLIGITNNFDFSGIQTAGIMISVVSFILWIVSRIQLANSFSVAPKATELVSSGIYSKIRHPVYVFSFLAVLGIFLFLQNWILFLLLIPLIILQIFRIRKEDKILVKEFGDTYTQYQRNTWF